MPLTGRRRELRELQLRFRDVRALTVIGPGGVGKTRLALGFAASRQSAFPDGRVLARLKEVRDPSHLIDAVAVALGLEPVSVPSEDGALLNAVVERLQGRMLLVLDGCEHLRDAVSRLIVALLHSCPDLRILATSRASLVDIGSNAFPLSPMRPDAEGRTDAEQLFLEFARRAVPGFRLDQRTTPLVRELVDALDYLPLAIESAAAELSSRSLEEMVSALQLGVVESHGVQQFAFNRLVQESLDASTDMCSDHERLLWARLSLFPASFDLEAAEEICGATPLHREEVLGLLDSLVSQSIIERAEDQDPPRFSLLSHIRARGSRMLSESESTALSRRFREHYSTLVQRADDDWPTSAQQRWLRVLPEERQNLFTVLGSQLDDPAAVRLAGRTIYALRRYYWWPQPWAREGLQWATQAIELLDESPLQARLLLLSSSLHAAMGNAAQAEAMLARGGSVSERSGDLYTVNLSSLLQAEAELGRGEGERASERLREIAANRESDLSQRTDALVLLISACSVTAGAPAAERAYEEAVRMLEPGEASRRSRALIFLSEALHRDQQPERAWLTAEAAQRLLGDDPLGAYRCWISMLEIVASIGDATLAAPLLRSGELLRERLGSEPPIASLEERRDTALARLRGAIGPARFGKMEVSSASASGAAVGHRRARSTAEAFTTLPTLTPREEEVAGLIAEGQTNREIASRLLLAQRTVDGHVRNILTKRGFKTRAQIASWFVTRESGSKHSTDG